MVGPTLRRLQLPCRKMKANGFSSSWRMTLAGLALSRWWWRRRWWWWLWTNFTVPVFYVDLGALVIWFAPTLTHSGYVLEQRSQRCYYIDLPGNIVTEYLGLGLVLYTCSVRVMVRVRISVSITHSNAATSWLVFYMYNIARFPRSGLYCIGRIGAWGVELVVRSGPLG